MLSRVNHKNFVNLIGFCEEEEPFTRMLVFEYAPNGTAFEHLHGNTTCHVTFFEFGSFVFQNEVIVSLFAFPDKEVEHLDWNARMRIIMGAAYCLQYMHELNPPVAHSNLKTNSIFLTDDYAAKVGFLLYIFSFFFFFFIFFTYDASLFCRLERSVSE